MNWLRENCCFITLIIIILAVILLLAPLPAKADEHTEWRQYGEIGFHRASLDAGEKLFRGSRSIVMPEYEREVRELSERYRGRPLIQYTQDDGDLSGSDTALHLEVGTHDHVAGFAVAYAGSRKQDDEISVRTVMPGRYGFIEAEIREDVGVEIEHEIMPLFFAHHAFDIYGFKPDIHLGLGFPIAKVTTSFGDDDNSDWKIAPAFRAGVALPLTPALSLSANILRYDLGTPDVQTANFGDVDVGNVRVTAGTVGLRMTF